MGAAAAAAADTAATAAVAEVMAEMVAAAVATTAVAVVVMAAKVVVVVDTTAMAAAAAADTVVRPAAAAAMVVMEEAVVVEVIAVAVVVAAMEVEAADTAAVAAVNVEATVAAAAAAKTVPAAAAVPAAVEDSAGIVIEGFARSSAGNEPNWPHLHPRGFKVANASLSVSRCVFCAAAARPHNLCCIKRRCLLFFSFLAWPFCARSSPHRSKATAACPPSRIHGRCKGHTPPKTHVAGSPRLAFSGPRFDLIPQS